MKNQENSVSTPGNPWYSLTGAFLLLIPLSLLGMWFYACSQTNDYITAQQFYTDQLPAFLQPRYATSLVSLPFCVIAVLINIHYVHAAQGWIKWLSRIVVILGVLLAFANLWSMM